VGSAKGNLVVAKKTPFLSQLPSFPEIEFLPAAAPISTSPVYKSGDWVAFLPWGEPDWSIGQVLSSF